MWLGILSLFVAVVGTWDKLWALAKRLFKVALGLIGWCWRNIKSPVPWSIRLAEAVDGFGLTLGWWLGRGDPRKHPRPFTAFNVPLTTWLQRPSAGMASYRRHLEPALRMHAKAQLDLMDA